MKLVYWPLMGGLLHLSEEGPGRGRSPPMPLLAVPKECTRCTEKDDREQQ